MVTVLDDDGQMDRKIPPLYEVSLGDADDVFALLSGLLRSLGAYAASAVVFVADGADWIWRRLDALVAAAEIPPERVTKILDFYHATEYIHATLMLCKDLSASDREAEFSRLKGVLLTEVNGIDTVIADLLQQACGRRSRAMKKKVSYLVGHRDHLKYASYREAQLPIGSGVVESTARRVINLRFKSASMAWRAEHLEPLLYLRGPRSSSRTARAIPRLKLASISVARCFQDRARAELYDPSVSVRRCAPSDRGCPDW